MYCAGKQERRSFPPMQPVYVQGLSIEAIFFPHCRGVQFERYKTKSRIECTWLSTRRLSNAQLTRPHKTRQMQTVWEKVVIFMDLAVLVRLPRKASHTGAPPSIAHIHITFLSSEGAALASPVWKCSMCGHRPSLAWDIARPNCLSPPFPYSCCLYGTHYITS